MYTLLSLNHHQIHALIEQGAYFNWINNGCPSGRDKEFWEQSKQQLRDSLKPLLPPWRDSPQAIELLSDGLSRDSQDHAVRAGEHECLPRLELECA